MLPTTAGAEPTTSYFQVRCASNWATDSGSDLIWKQSLEVIIVKKTVSDLLIG